MLIYIYEWESIDTKINKKLYLYYFFVLFFTKSIIEFNRFITQTVFTKFISSKISYNFINIIDVKYTF